MRFVLRGLRLVVVAVAIALLTVVPMSALLLHGSDSDDACSTSAAQHDAAQHRIDADTAHPNSSHCVICHWWVSGGRYNGRSLFSPETAHACIGFVARARVVDPQRAEQANRPARAPPAA